MVAYYDAVCNYKTVPVEKDVPLGELREGDSEAVDVTGDGAGMILVDLLTRVLPPTLFLLV